MRRVTGRAALALAGLAGHPAAAPCQQPDTTAGVQVYAEARIVSRYIWRGYDISRAQPALQPYVEVSLPNGLGLNVFTSTAMDRKTELDEAQIGFTFSREVGGSWELGVGLLGYVAPGTETEPGSDPADPFAATTSGELVASVTRSWDAGYATLTYSRGQGAGAGNSVNIWAQHAWTWAAGRWSVEPYLQVDYLDEYGPPAGLRERMSGVELGVPLYLRMGGIRFLAAGYATVVPSSYVRTSNASAGSSSREVLTWVALGVVHGRD